MTGNIIGSGQDRYQRRYWWVAVLGFLLLVTGVLLMMIVLVVAARNSGGKSIPGAADQALVAGVNRAAESLPVDISADSSQNGFAPGAIPPDSVARQALADGSARLVIEAIGVDAPIQPVGLMEVEANGQTFGQWQVPNDYAAGWHRTSAGLGVPGNMVLNGHNNVHGAVFRELDELGYGDEIIIRHGQDSYRYQVAHRELLDESDQPLSVRLDNAKWISHTADERLTLISCWPYVNNTQRLIVIATPADRDQR